MRKSPYIIVAPPYRHNSAGVRAIYELGNRLKERGYNVKMTQGCRVPDDAIVVYPETVPGNILNGKTVVRYVLNYPGALGGDKEYASNEIIFTYHQDYYPNAPVLAVPIIEEFFADEGLEREGGCFWVGKGIDVEEDPRTKGLTEITYDWPPTRREVAHLLNTKEVFYTYDDCTSLIEEARRCGCKVVIISGENKSLNYNESIRNFDKQLDEFIRITQEAANKEIKVSFGVLVNDMMRLDMVLRQSGIKGEMHTVKNPETATQGLNKLLELMENEGADIGVLTHQDMYFRNGWIEQMKEQIGKLPDSWIVAGIIGKDMKGNICGRMHDMRIPLHFSTSHDFPHPASCFDECCIIVNMKKGFRFDEGLKGFDLYGTLCVLQAQEQGGTAWIIDAFAEHFCMRPFSWYPDKAFEDCFKWIHQRFPNAERIDTTVIGLPREENKAA